MDQVALNVAYRKRQMFSWLSGFELKLGFVIVLRLRWPIVLVIFLVIQVKKSAQYMINGYFITSS